MQKRGNIMGLPLVYILIVVIMGLVLYFGFDSISKIMLAKDITEISKFVLDLEDEVQVVYSYDVGSAKKFKSLALGKKVDYVCFFNPQKSISLSQIELSEMDEEVGYLLGIESNDNLYLLPTGAYGSPYPDFFIPHLKIEDSKDNPYCFLNTNKGVQFVLNTYLENNQIYVGVDDVP